MAKKIDIRIVAKVANEIIDNYPAIKLAPFSLSSVGRSERIEETAKMVLEYYLPLIVIIALLYYSKKPREQLTTEEIDAIKKNIDDMNDEFNKQVTNNVKTYAESAIKKLINYTLDKEGYEAHSGIIFNDGSKEHENAFGLPVRQFPKKNILIKLSGPTKEHYRFAVKIETETIFLNFSRKKTRNN